MINTIIFSKDRACQLAALLESFNDHFKAPSSVSIIYTTSSPSYSNGYEILQKEWPQFDFIKETDFRANVLDLITSNCKYVMFLVDDIVFIRDVEIDSSFDHFDKDESILTLSLQLSPDVTFEYPRQKYIKLPDIENSTYNWLNRWNKRKYKKSNEWGAGWDCVMSVGGNIFRTKDILPYIQKIDFHNPNTMEGNMQKSPIKSKPFMICCDKVKLICMPVNIVAENVYNRHGEINAETLNNKWLNGLKIDVKPIYNIETNAIHNILDLNFIKRGT